MPTGPVQIIAPTIVRMTLTQGNPANRNASCIVDVSLDESGTDRASAVASMVPRVVTAWQENIVSHFGPGMGFEGCHYTDLDSLDGSSGDVPPQAGHPTTGSDVNVLCPPNVAMLVRKNTVHGRSGKNGRMYIPNVAETKVDAGGIIESAFRTAWQTNVNAFRLALESVATSPGTSVWRVVHVHKTDRDDPSTWSWSSSDVDTVSVDSIVATQRRRLRD